MFVYPKKSYFSRAKHTHTTTKHFFKTNLTFYSIRVVVYVDGYIAVIQKMRIKTKHSTTQEIFFFMSICMVLFVVRISFFDDIQGSARGSGIHDFYFPGACGLGIHEVLSS